MRAWIFTLALSVLLSLPLSVQAMNLTGTWNCDNAPVLDSNAHIWEHFAIVSKSDASLSHSPIRVRHAYC